MAKDEGLPKGRELVAKKKERSETRRRGHRTKKVQAAHHEKCGRAVAREEKYNLPETLSALRGGEGEE